MTRPIAFRRTLAAVALAPLLVTGLGACGGDDSGSRAEDPAAAAVLTGLQKGDHVDPGDFVDTVSDGVKASTTAHMTMKSSLGSMGEISGEGDLDYTADPPEVALTMTTPLTGDSKTEVRFVDGVFYISLGSMSGNKFWKVDPSDPDSPLADFGSMADQVDPMGTLKKLEPAIEKVTYVGDEDVDGQSLAHYELTVDPAEMAKSMDVPAEVQKQMPDTLTYDIWLDDQDRLSKLHMDIPVAGTESSVDLTASDWGKDVSIEAPPADEVTDMPDMGSLMSPGASA